MGPGTRNSFSEFDQDIEGYYGQATTNFSTGSVKHSLTYGVDYYEKRVWAIGLLKHSMHRVFKCLNFMLTQRETTQ